MLIPVSFSRLLVTGIRSASLRNRLRAAAERLHEQDAVGFETLDRAHVEWPVPVADVLIGPGENGELRGAVGKDLDSEADGPGRESPPAASRS